MWVSLNEPEERNAVTSLYNYTCIPESSLFLYISELCYSCETALLTSLHSGLCCKKINKNNHVDLEKVILVLLDFVTYIFNLFLTEKSSQKKLSLLNEQFSSRNLKGYLILLSLQ